MGYMQAFRVGGKNPESALRKVSLLLTGEGIDCDELGDERPEVGCVLIDFTAGEDLVKKTEQTVPHLPQILVASTQSLGIKQLAIADEFVSADMPAPEIIRRVQCMENLSVRIREEVPEPAHTRILIDGDTQGDDAPLKNLAKILTDAEISWEPLKEETDPVGSGIVYTHYRRQSYARLLQRDYPGYIHVQMAPTPELRIEALTVGDISYTRNTLPEEIVVRHKRLLHMLHRLRNPDNFRRDPLEHRAMRVLFIGDRNVGTELRTGGGEDIEYKAMATVAGALAEAKKNDAVLIHLGGKEDAKERFAFLQALLKSPDKPPTALYFQKETPEKMKEFCDKSGVTIIASKTSAEVKDLMLELWK